MSDRTFDFTLLGEIALRRADGTAVGSVVAQYKRVGLLAYLAIEGAERPLFRASFLNVFWPDADPERARNSLRTALHHLRRSLGSDAIVTQGDAIRLDPEVVRTDAVALLEAARRGAHKEVLERYAGPLLPGLSLDGHDFEEWLYHRRRAVELAYSTAALTLAETHPGDPEWLPHVSRVVDMAPTNQEAMRTLVTGLARFESRAAALARFAAWQEDLRDAWQEEASAETVALVESLRQPEAPTVTAFSGTSDETVPEEATTGSRAAAGPAGAGTEGGPGAAPARERRRGRLATVVAGGVVVIAGLALGLWSGRGGGGGSASPPDLLVSDFSTGAGAPEYLSSVVPELVARHLDESGAVVLGHPESGVKLSCKGGGTPGNTVLVGSVASKGAGAVRIEACLVDARGQILTTAQVTASLTDLLAAGRSLARTLWSALGPVGDFHPAPAFVGAPGALPAYAAGERAWRDGDMAAAAKAYDDAVALDSTFAWAQYRLSTASEWLSRTQAAQQAADRALAESQRLSHRELELLNAWRLYAWGHIDQAVEAYERLVVERPQDPEVLFRAGELRFHWGSRLGISRATADSAFTGVLARLPGNVPSMLHHARYLGHIGDTQGMIELMNRAKAAGTSDAELRRLRTAVALQTGDTATLREVSVPWLESMDGAEHMALYSGLLAGTVRLPDQVLALTDLLPRRGAQMEVGWRWTNVLVLGAAGRFREARAQADSLAALNPARGVEAAVVLTMAPMAQVDRDSLIALRERLAALPPPSNPLMGSRIYDIGSDGIFPLRRVFFDTWLAWLIDGRVPFDHAFAAANAVPNEFRPKFANLIRELNAVTEGRPETVLNIIGRPGLLPDPYLPDAMSQVWALERWWRIQALMEMGREDDALRWLGTFGDDTGHDVIFLGPSLVLQGELRERRGEDRQAAAAYRWALDMWRHADSTPALEKWRGRARAGLNRIGAQF